MALSKRIRQLLWGDPFGDVYPRREPPPPPVYDGRTAGLRILREYFSELTFFRPGGKDELGESKDPIAFKIHPRDIHVEWPDNEAELRAPSLAFLSIGPANYDAIGMTSYVDENWQKEHPGRLLTWMSEYVETFSIDVWCETKQQRRAVILGLEQSLSPLEYMAGIRFVMPDYYGQLVCFSLQNREIIDDDQASLLRRKARLLVEMRFNVVAEYPVNPMEPIVEVQVDTDEDTNTPVFGPDDIPADLDEGEQEPGEG